MRLAVELDICTDPLPFNETTSADRQVGHVAHRLQQ
jgi:hypothetical protein